MNNNELDFEKIFVDKKPLELVTFHARNIFIDKIETVLSGILSRKNYQNLYMTLLYVIQEFVANADKANLKRVYFKDNNLDISKETDYVKGIKKFTDIIKDGAESITGKLVAHDKYIKVVFKEFAHKVFTLEIINNSELLPVEKKRILEKISEIRGKHDIDEIIDLTEGAGMGIYLSLRILAQSGIKANSISIFTRDKQTVSQISFKYKDVKQPPYPEIARDILKEAGELPRFPENLRKIIEMISDKESTLAHLADFIEREPGVSADILKLVNSAKFMLSRKIGSIKEAINYIGLKSLKHLIYSYGAIKAIDNRFGTIPEVWEHCYETARIATRISITKKISDKSDDFFTAGLLHDIGKIVMMNLNKEKVKKIDKLYKQRGEDLPIMEELLMGISHARIGGEIAKIWEFPQELIQSIMYHHDPLMADENLKAIVYTVYLANFLANHTDEEKLDIMMLEPVVRKYFSINNNDNFKKLSKLVRE